MSDFLLIHGTGHGAWCFRDLIAALQDRGHSARAIDLPAHGADTTPITDATLASYANAILAAIDTPVTLLGHSMGGFPITQAACFAPEKIAQLVYLCAYVPAPGKSLVEMRRAWPEQPLAGAFITAKDRSSFHFRPDLVQEKLYQDCPPGTLEYARTHLCDEPAAPSMTPITGDHSLARSYIRCNHDQAIPPAYQHAMSAGWDSVADMDCGHSPFFADPKGLAGILTNLT